MSLPEGEKKVLDALTQANIHRRIVPDVDRVWSNFFTFQLYSPEEKLTHTHIDSLTHDHSNTSGKGFFEYEKFVSPCTPENRIRVVKLGSTASFQNLEDRALPVSTLQSLLLFDQVLPLSNFYYKFQLRDGISDDLFLNSVRKFNEDKGERQFHYVFNGVSTSLFHPPCPLVPLSRITKYPP